VCRSFDEPSMSDVFNSAIHDYIVDFESFVLGCNKELLTSAGILFNDQISSGRSCCKYNDGRGKINISQEFLDRIAEGLLYRDGDNLKIFFDKTGFSAVIAHDKNKELYWYIAFSTAICAIKFHEVAHCLKSHSPGVSSTESMRQEDEADRLAGMMMNWYSDFLIKQVSTKYPFVRSDQAESFCHNNIIFSLMYVIYKSYELIDGDSLNYQYSLVRSGQMIVFFLCEIVKQRPRFKQAIEDRARCIMSNFRYVFKWHEFYDIDVHLR